MGYADRPTVGSERAKVGYMTDWRELPGYEGLYKISSDGQVWSVRGGRLLNPTVSPHGYHSYGLSRDGNYRKFRAHRLVALTFIGPEPEGKPYVLHENDIPNDNRVGNLRWGSPKENLADCKRNGNFNSGRWNGDMCRAGLHPWNDENAGVNSSGRRMCKPCQQESWRRARTSGLPPQDDRHGTAYGGRKGCCCEPCVDALRATRARYRRAR